ncbi:MAG: hypothetical protein GXP48_03735 [Acidobacteria bacterium]|nr:hypothetical protein [Acidobacteriota bacterium]
MTRCDDIPCRPGRSAGKTLRLRIPGALVALAFLVCVMPAVGQALHTEHLPNGTALILVSTPGATATSLAWPAPDPSGALTIRTITRGDLGLIPDAETALTGKGPAPPVVVAVGAAGVTALRGMLERVLAGRPPAVLPARRTAPLDEGDIERRLEPPGTPATLRLSLPLPPPGSTLRASAEVLGEMLPELLKAQAPALHSRLASGTLVLEATIDAASGDETVSRLRLALAQLSQAPHLDPASVAAVRTRLEVRRLASLEEMPGGASRLVSIWLKAGAAGVRRFLFGLDGVSVATVRRAVTAWLASHPGHAVLLLPPQALNPRFASPPRAELLANGINVVLLERPVSGLAVLDLVPVLVPDLDSQTAALILTRLAGWIRESAEAPGWIRVTVDPAALELATAPDSFPQLCEVLSGALQALDGDRRPVHVEESPHHRALQLMAALFGFPDTDAITPSRLLQPSNLAIGAVIPDTGTAREALAKFLATLGGPKEGVRTQEIAASPETRAPMPGNRSAFVIALPLTAATAAPDADVAGALVLSRMRALLKGATLTLSRPVVPGRQVLLLEVEMDGPLDTLEDVIKKAWGKIIALPSDRELEPVQGAVAAKEAAASNGALGAARVCAVQAAGVGTWRSSGAYERSIISVDAKDLAPVLGAWRDLASLQTTGAGPFPATDLPPAAR